MFIALDPESGLDRRSCSSPLGLAFHPQTLCQRSDLRAQDLPAERSGQHRHRIVLVAPVGDHARPARACARRSCCSARAGSTRPRPSRPRSDHRLPGARAPGDLDRPQRQLHLRLARRDAQRLRSWRRRSPTRSSARSSPRMTKNERARARRSPTPTRSRDGVLGQSRQRATSPRRHEVAARRRGDHRRGLERGRRADRAHQKEDVFWFYSTIFLAPLLALGAGWLATRRRRPAAGQGSKKEAA